MKYSKQLEIFSKNIERFFATVFFIVGVILVASPILFAIYYLTDESKYIESIDDEYVILGSKRSEMVRDLNNGEKLRCAGLFIEVIPDIHRHDNNQRYIVVKKQKDTLENENSNFQYQIIDTETDYISKDLSSDEFSTKCDSLHIQPNFVIE